MCFVEYRDLKAYFAHICLDLCTEPYMVITLQRAVIGHYIGRESSV